MEEDEDVIEILHSLKESIVCSGELTKDCRQYLQQIYDLISEDRSLTEHLEKWKFVEKQLLYVLRQTSSFSIGLEFLLLMLEYDKMNVPKCFYTKKFVFFITDKLYSLLNDPTLIIVFVRRLIEKDHTFVYIFHECGFFVLLNSCLELETCKLYAAVFRNTVDIGLDSPLELDRYNTRRKDSKMCKNTPGDIMFEVQRKLFDNEIVFSDSNLMSFKLRNYCFRRANSKEKEIFDDLLNTSIYNLIDICLDDEIQTITNVLKFKYFNYDFLLDNASFYNLCFEGDLMSLRTVRLIIENVEDKLLLLKLDQNNYFKRTFKLLEQKNISLRYEVVLSLSSFLERIDNSIDVTFIDELKIRKIVSLLEYRCTECNCLYKKCPEKIIDDSTSFIDENEKSVLESSIVRNENSDSINTCKIVSKLKDNVTSDLINSSTIKSDVSDFEILTDISKIEENKVVINRSCLKNCRTLQIALFLLKISKKVKQEYFYKVSYLIIFKSLYDALKEHACFDKSHFLEYFKCFLEFLRKDRYNLSRLLFPFKTKKERPKIEVDDHKEDSIPEENSFEDTYLENKI